MNLESTITDVIENVTSLPKLAVGTATSFVGAIGGNIPSIERVPTLQYFVWGTAIVAAIATAALACVRIYLEVKKAKRDRVLD